MHSVIFREERASGSSLSKHDETWYHHWRRDPKNERTFEGQGATTGRLTDLNKSVCVCMCCRCSRRQLRP